ncbi:MAG: hypothetical protein J0L82_04455 [Deltaproteobacteria bacterium]|nr:hypothetical protein [Deltaproteobacteria bacterium]
MQDQKTPFAIKLLIGLAIISMIPMDAFASDEISIRPHYPSLKIAETWSFQALSREWERVHGYHGISDREVERNDGILTVLYVPPFNLLSLAYLKIAGRDSDEVAHRILSACRDAPAMADKISCISYEVSKYSMNIPATRTGITFDFRTFCAVAANLFVKIFNGLNIRGARADFLESSWKLPRSLHVVNSIFLTTPSGIVYSYAIDVGSLPGILFPLSESAVRWHSLTTEKSEFSLEDSPEANFGLMREMSIR